MGELVLPDEGGLSPYEPDESHIVHRTSRIIRFNIEAEIAVEVVEPPTVHNAELKSLARAHVNRALASLNLGVVTELKVKVVQGG